MSSKAQIFSLDAVIASGIFIIIFLALAGGWEGTREKMFLAESRTDLEILARNALSSLLETPGDPSNWQDMGQGFNASSVYSLGLTKNRPWLIDDDKVLQMEQWNSQKYEVYKEVLGIRGADYEFYLRFWECSGGNCGEEANYTIGNATSSTAENVVRISRTALLDNQSIWLKVVMEVWKECEGVTC